MQEALVKSIDTYERWYGEGDLKRWHCLLTDCHIFYELLILVPSETFGVCTQEVHRHVTNPALAPAAGMTHCTFSLLEKINVSS